MYDEKHEAGTGINQKTKMESIDKHEKGMISMNERTSMIENNDKHEWNDKYGEANN